MVGNFGFDLITWEALKGFIDTRDKVLAMTPQFRFNPRDQLLRIIPEPLLDHTYLGVVGCYIERPIKDLISERWILNFSMALTQITIGHTRGKFAGTSMFGGGTVNASDMMSQGLAAKEKLEDELKNSYEDSQPVSFYIG